MHYYAFKVLYFSGERLYASIRASVFVLNWKWKVKSSRYSMHAENSNPVHSMHTAEMVVCHPMGHISANATYCIVQIACVFECSVVCGSHMLWWRRQPVEVRWG